MPPLLRQGSHYVLFGLLQLLLDWAVFVATTWLGMPASRGNLAGRVSGALLGYWLNGRFTFSDGSGTRLGWRRFLRFALMWTALTVASTLLVGWTAANLGLHLAWLAKPLVELALSVVGFLVSRHWVYRD